MLLVVVTGIRTHVPTWQKVTRLPTELPGRTATSRINNGMRTHTHTHGMDRHPHSTECGEMMMIMVMMMIHTFSVLSLQLKKRR